MKPLEVWTCQRAENLKKTSSKIQKNNYAATMVSARADKLSAAARRSTKVGGAHKLSAAAPCIGARLYLHYVVFRGLTSLCRRWRAGQFWSAAERRRSQKNRRRSGRAALAQKMLFSKLMFLKD